MLQTFVKITLRDFGKVSEKSCNNYKKKLENIMKKIKTHFRRNFLRLILANYVSHSRKSCKYLVNNSIEKISTDMSENMEFLDIFLN